MVSGSSSAGSTGECKMKHDHDQYVIRDMLGLLTFREVLLYRM